MQHKPRTWFIALVVYLGFFAIIARLFYWQVIQGDSLQAIAQTQYQRTLAFLGERGSIKTSDGYLLASNQAVYRLFANPRDIADPTWVAEQIAPMLVSFYESQAQEKQNAISKIQDRKKSQLESIEDLDIETPHYDNEITTEKLAEQITEQIAEQKAYLLDRLSLDRSWVSLASKIDQKTKQDIESLQIHGIGFDTYSIRAYPEEDLAAHILGFVGKNEAGEDMGYFGLEGALNNELKKRRSQKRIDTGLFGFQIFQNRTQPLGLDGRDVTLSVRRDIQFLLETMLQEGMQQYGAKQGEIIVMDPKTGKILGMASTPHYHPAYFYDFDQETYRNPAVSHLFEPGSTFKPLTIAAGIEEGVITPNTECPRCNKAVQIGRYSIRTWNDVYTENINMTEALRISDNTAMVYIAQEIGSNNFESYLRSFGIGTQVTEDFQEDRNTPFPSKWGAVELATRSFGQGISLTSMQLIRAIAAIANNGIMMQPSLLQSVYDPVSHTEIEVEPKVVQRIFSPQTAKEVTGMMVVSAEHGEAQWTASKTHTIAAKTGTAQIAIPGGYDPSKTIATYIGFAPAQNPQYIMLVKLVEPQSSHWAAETAAPLWHKVARQLHLLLKIPPDKVSS